MIFLYAYLAIGVACLVLATLYALDVRGLINSYPGEYRPGVEAKKLADSALLVLIAPVWPVGALFFVVRAVWSLVKDVRAYYFKSNRKESDDR